MALLRPRDFLSIANPHAQPSQDSQPSPPPSMSLPPSDLTALAGGRFTSTSTSASTSEASSETTPPSLQTTLKPTASGRSGNSIGASTRGSSADSSSTTLLASTSFSELGASASSSSSSSLSASTAPAAITTGAEVKCTSLSCNPGKAAAIFVPIAIVSALLVVCLAFCVRRKGRARLGQGLAFFSHGAETNYVSASASSAGNSRAPSMREVGSSSGPLAAGVGLGAAGAAGLAAARGHPHNHDFGLGFVPDMLSRSSSCAAPPPYAPRQSTELNHDAVEPADITSRSPVAAPAAAHTHTTSDPFADTPNPFADENASLLSGDTAINRETGSRRSARDNASIVSSLQDLDEAGSIRDAQVANVSRGPSLTGGPPRPGRFS